MKLLIVNTLPEAEAAEAIALLRAAATECQVIHTEQKNIRPCIGCTYCWLKTPGTCVIQDDYQELLQAYLDYETVIYIGGTALGFIDHKVKNLLDRILPLATMLTCFKGGQMRHVPRYPNKRFRFGLLYRGDADGAYLNRWMERVAINLNGASLGAFPIAEAKEAAKCIL